MGLGETLSVDKVDETSSSKVEDAASKEEDPYDIVKATQYGVYERCKELIDNGFDVNQRDSENITLLHWAAINSRKDIVKLYIEAGAIVDAVGGELLSTPLHWATRQGHLNMVVFLMKEGADPTLRDGEGCSAIHLAAQFGYTPIVAYLLAKGISPDIQDRNGMTALMWACARVQAPDPVRLLLTFGADTFIQEKTHQNTALHWAIHSKNSTALTLLLKKGASLDLANSEGETPFSLIKKLNLGKSDWIGRNAMECVKEKMEPKKSGRWEDLKQNKRLKFWVTTLIPFVLMYLVGEILAADIGIFFKLALFVVAFVVFRGIGRFVCDDRFMSIFPINVYLATKFWMYLTWIIFIAPALPATDTVYFILSSTFLWYCFIRAWRGDPGVIIIGKEERYQTIIDLAEEDGFDPKYFCTTCLVRKPMRSKHCSLCDRCVAKFDHHCPWLSNCVGWKNHKYFVGYLFSLVVMCIQYLMGAIGFWQATCLGGEGARNLFKIITCNPWVTFMTVQAMIHGVWVFCLLICQLYQILWLGVTTNERLNFSRYNYFGQPVGLHGSDCTKGDCKSSSGRKKKHVFSRSPWQNTVDFFELSWFRGFRRVDWSRAYAPLPSHSNEAGADPDIQSLLKDNRDNYQYV